MINPGFMLQNAQPYQDAGCYIVVGLARGGTSSIAAALHALGIFMGDLARPPNYEDRRLISSIPAVNLLSLKRRDWSEFEATLRQYDLQHAWWGFKYPSLHTDLEKAHQLFRNPRYIFIYRDVLAISSRRSQIFPEHDHFRFMQDYLNKYAQIIRFAEKHAFPALHVSYEKMLTNTEAFSSALCEFCNIPISSDNSKTISSVISPSPEKYTAWTVRHANSKRKVN
jgi:hypothetical protein